MRIHYKHLDEATTEAGYFPAIQRLRADCDSEVYSATVDFFVSAVLGRKLAGRMAAQINEYFSAEKWKAIRQLGELRREIELMVRIHDLRIYFSSHGNCFIRLSPTKSRCRRAEGFANWKLNSPSHQHRTPGMCAGCGVYCADKSHLPFWEARAEMSTAARDGYESKVIRDRRLQAVQMVKQLKE